MQAVRQRLKAPEPAVTGRDLMNSHMAAFDVQARTKWSIKLT